MSRLKTHWLGASILAAALVFGFFSYEKYGIAWDEDDQRELGAQNYRFVFEGDPSLNGFINRYYGPGIELPLTILEKWSGRTDPRDIFLFRRVCLHLFFLAGMVCAYFLLFGIYRSPVLAAVGPALILTAPHLYAHSFFNSKDIPFLVLNIFNFYGAFRLFSKPSFSKSLLLGVSMGLTINLRVLGAIPFGLILFFLAADLLDKKSAATFSQKLFLTLLFIVSTAGALVVSFPLLWAKPLKMFIEASQKMSQYPWICWVLTNWKNTPSNELRWDYAPTWIAVTTPVPHLLIGLLGLLWFRFDHWHSGKSVFSDLKTRMNFLFFACFLSPFIAVWMLDPVLLDGWRHLFFTFAPFIFLGVFGLEKLFSKGWKKPALAVAALGISSSAFFMIKNAPYQHLFFNFLVNREQPEKIRLSYEMDFWGLGYREALEYVLANDPSPKIKINAANYPGKSNAQMLKKADRERLEFVDSTDDAQYFITNYRFHPNDYPEFEPFKWHSLRVDNNSFITIFKLK